ncbi:FHIPEP family type III secretion protein [Pseudacidovorax intermedius]|uniref:FHIPEP family type III secretion protein n=1 Tax=Pseudacidovorax intermedius TaxID=433924 RepID=UPI002F2B5BD0
MRSSRSASSACSLDSPRRDCIASATAKPPWLVQQAERMMKSNLLPVLLCAPELRRHLRALSERVMPHLRVLSMSEVPHSMELKSFSVVQL